MTDNAKAYGGHAFQAACQRYRIAHTTTKPYRPCTNGKAERFIQTLLRNGPTSAPTRPHGDVPKPYLGGSATTITADPMAVSTHDRPSPGSTAPVNNVLRKYS
jgi:transposase InsO family protein